MNKKCNYCDEIIDYSHCDAYSQVVMSINDLICNTCKDTNILYTCTNCDKTLSQPVATSLTRDGLLIKNKKICLDCNIRMTEKVLL